MHTILLTTLFWLTNFVAPFLLLVGVGVGLFKRFSAAKVVALLGALLLACISVTSVAFGPDGVDWHNPEASTGFWDHTTIRMFLSGAGLLLFAIGFAWDNLCEEHRKRKAEHPPAAYSSKAADGLVGNAEE